MEYPGRPSFADIFWYQVVLDDRSVWLCSATWLEFIAQLQRVLSTMGILSAPSYDHVSVSSADVSIDLRWGATTQRMLWRAALNLGLPPLWVEAIASEGMACQARAAAHRTDNPLGTVSVYAAIYIIMTSTASSGLFIESGTGPEILRVQAFDPPQWNALPPMTTHGTPRDIGCVSQVSSPTPGVSTVPEPAPGELAAPAVPAEPAPGQPPLPIPVGQPATRVDITLAPGRQPTTVVESGVSWGPIAIGAALIVATVVVVRSLRSQPEPARAPARRRKVA